MNDEQDMNDEKKLNEENKGNDTNNDKAKNKVNDKLKRENETTTIQDDMNYPICFETLLPPIFMCMEGPRHGFR